MIDVGGNDSPPARNLGTDQLRGDSSAHGSSKGLGISRGAITRRGDFVVAAQVFPDRDEFHFRRDDALSGVVKLGDYST